MRLKALLALLGLLICMSGAVAQPSGFSFPPVNYQNAVGNYSAPGFTIQYLNAASPQLSVPVSAANPMPVSSTPVVPVLTPSAPSQPLSLTAGSTAQNLFAANEVSNGCVIKNPVSASDQGIAVAENVYVSFVTTAIIGGGSTSVSLEPGSSIACPGKMTTATSWIAQTIGHRIMAYKD